MSTSTTFQPVTEGLLQAVVRRIRSVGSPDKIDLFGSQAAGMARPDSDLDLLIVEECPRQRGHRAGPYYRVLAGLSPAKDIIVRIPAEIAEWANVPNAFVTTALRKDLVLYERSK